MACSSEKHLAEGEKEVKKVVVVSDNEAINTRDLRHFVRQLPGRTNGKRRHLAYDSLQTALSCNDLATALHNEGYLQATVTAEAKLEKDAEVTYTLHPGTPYTLRKISYDIRDERIDSLLTAGFDIHHRSSSHLYGSPLRAGSIFSVTSLNEERSLITSLLQDNGYYRFNKDFIRFHADTVAGQHCIDLTLILLPYKPNNNTAAGPHPHYTVRSVNYLPADNEKVDLRQSVLEQSTTIGASKPYSASAVQDTYRRFGRLKAVRYTNIGFDEINDTLHLSDSTTSIDHLLNCNIQLATSKANTISFQPEGTNTAGNLGAAASLIYENRNLFHGSETWSVQLRGAFEAITGLEGYQNHDYEEYGAETRLTFPRFLAPFLNDVQKRDPTAQSEVSVSYNLQNRPEFHRRVFSAALRYRWHQQHRNRQWKLDLIDLDYIYMPWISETFKRDYLDSVSNRNAILRYNYEDLFIMKIGLGMTYSNTNNAVKWSIESSGNLLNAFSRLLSLHKNSEGQYTLFNIAYAQYVKGDLEATHMFKFSPTSELVVHAGLGIAYPYGNSSVLPFEKRYFAGGANSVRGWSVRSLGPGRFIGTDGRIDFINQTGDMKLDLNVEYRTFLFWKFSGAAFIDAGNIWTIRNYPDQPGGQFRFDEFYKQLAVGYGLGLRMNFGYFILRFDMGMKAVNPAYTNSREHYPLLHPRLSRDFNFHFAVGLPF